MTGTSPPGPLRCGSTTCSVNAVAAPASNALPPFSSVAIPTAVAIQCVEVTTPKVLSISGRVVNGSGLILLMKNPAACGAGAALEHSRSGMPTGVSVSRTRCGILHDAAQSRDRTNHQRFVRPRLCSAPRREERRAALRPGNGTALRIHRHVHRMAGDAVDQRGRLPAAQVEGQRAARVEG